MATDTSERGLERWICTALTGCPCDPAGIGEMVEPPARYGGVGWVCGNPRDYDRDYCVDLVQLSAFLRATQLELAEPLRLDGSHTAQGFGSFTRGNLQTWGVYCVLVCKHGAHSLELFQGTASVCVPDGWYTCGIAHPVLGTSG